MTQTKDFPATYYTQGSLLKKIFSTLKNSPSFPMESQRVNNSKLFKNYFAAS